MMKPYFAGIPIFASPHVPKDELWLVQRGEKVEVLCEEGPHASETAEIWLKKHKVHKIINLGEL